MTSTVLPSNLTVSELPRGQWDAVVPLLLAAETSEPALRWGLHNLSDAVYRLDANDQLVGAVSVQWRNDPAEIEELAIDPAQRGRGYGQLLVAWVVAEARRRHKRAIIVGTANSSLRNFGFYQRCGFRFDHVRKDYFGYYREPVIENGLQKRDLVVFRMELR